MKKKNLKRFLNSIIGFLNLRRSIINRRGEKQEEEFFSWKEIKKSKEKQL